MPFFPQKRKEFFHAHQLDMFDKGNPESINPDLPVDEQAELLPYDRKWEFPRERLKLGTVIMKLVTSRGTVP